MPISEAEFLLRLFIAIVLGGAIGWERELRELPAGLRTHVLVSLASATFGLVSFYVAYFLHYPADAQIRVDSTRIASNIVVGMGFLGGGAILHAGLTVRGLTTAASLWLTAAIGLAAGGGMYLLAVASTVICLFALVVLKFAIEKRRRRILLLAVRIDLTGDFLSRTALVEFLKPVNGVVSQIDYRRNFATNRSRMTMEVRLNDEALEEPLMKRLEELPGVTGLRVERHD